MGRSRVATGGQRAGNPHPSFHAPHHPLPLHHHLQGFRLLLSTGAGYDADVAPFLAEFGSDVRDYVALALGVTPPSASATPGNEPGSTVFVRRWGRAAGVVGGKKATVDKGKKVFCVPAQPTAHPDLEERVWAVRGWGQRCVRPLQPTN